MAVKFIHMTETDFLQKKLIHKNCSLENCLDLLKNNHIWFANPEKWHDPFESMFLTTNYKLTSSGITKKHPWHQRPTESDGRGQYRGWCPVLLLHL